MNAPVMKNSVERTLRRERIAEGDQMKVDWNNPEGTPFQYSVVDLSVTKVYDSGRKCSAPDTES